MWRRNITFACELHQLLYWVGVEILCVVGLHKCVTASRSFGAKIIPVVDFDGCVTDCCHLSNSNVGKD
jgi:uncharacterized metal-binding protein